MAERAVKPENDKGAKFVERIENLNADLDKMKSAYMNECKAVREDIKEVLKEAKGDGFNKSTIKAVVTARALERRAEAAREDLDMADRDVFDNIRHELGDLAETPLGKAAMEAAGAPNGAADAGEIPENLRRKQPEAAA